MRGAKKVFIWWRSVWWVPQIVWFPTFCFFLTFPPTTYTLEASSPSLKHNLIKTPINILHLQSKPTEISHPETLKFSETKNTQKEKLNLFPSPRRPQWSFFVIDLCWLLLPSSISPSGKFEWLFLGNPFLETSKDMETMICEKQGIVAILGPDSDKPSNRAPASLRRTLSADMSSKNWLSQNGFLKKIASLNEFPIFEPSPSSSSSSSAGEEIEEEEEGKIVETGRGFDICVSIQDERNNLREKTGGFDLWNSILSQKVQEDKPVTPPYIHPLVKQAASSLSEKSLEICTESLGSETGSDGFSSEIGEEDSNNNSKEKQEFQEQREKEIRQEKERESIRVAKNSYLRSKKPAPRTFPPPISSLSQQDGASTHIKTRRDDGRLVLEAVSVPCTKCFSAQRQNGRLVLTFTKNFVEEEKARKFEKLDENLEGIQDAIEENDEDKEREMEDEVEEGSFVTEQAPKLSNGLIRVHRLALIMNKPISSANTNPAWPKRLPSLNEDVDVGVDMVVDVNVDKGVGKAKLLTSLAQSLPPRPPVPRQIPSQSPRPSKTAVAAPSFNVYDYYWRPNTMLKGFQPNPIAQFVINAPNKTLYSRNAMKEESRRNKHEVGEESQHKLTLNSCKEQRRSLLLWEPYCIATS